MVKLFWRASLDATDYALPPQWRPVLSFVPRSYQRQALTAWHEHQGRGVVVLPTGAGKTVVALMAIEHLAARTLIVVPTLELLTQWRRACSSSTTTKSSAAA